MSKTTRVIAGIVGFVIGVPLILLIVFFITFDPNALKKQITQQLSTSLGREIAVDGPVQLGFSKGIALTLKAVRVGNPQGFTQKDFLKIGTLDLSLDTAALMTHRINITRFHLDDASIDLITLASGENNWDIKIPGSTPPTPAEQKEKAEGNKQAEATTGFRIDQVDLAEIEITKTTIRRIDAKGGKPTTVVLDKATIVPPRDGALKVEVKGKLNDAPVDANLQVEKGWGVLVAHQPSPVDAKITYGGATYALKALFEGQQNNYALKNMQANINGIEATGTVSVRTGANVPYISGNIDIPEINLTSLPRASASRQPMARVQELAAADAARAISIAAQKAAPDLSFLKAANADLDISCAKLVFKENQALEKVKTKAGLNSGVLRLSPLTADFLGVPYEGSIDVNGAAVPPTTHLVLKGKNVDFEKLGTALGGGAPLKAHGDISVDLNGQGLDQPAFMRTLSGRIEMTAGKGGVDMGSGGATAIQLVKLLYPKTTATPQQNLNCGAARFNVKNGVMNSDGILFDSPIAAVAADGKIDLVQNNADLVLHHAVKDDQAGSIINVPIRASGPLNSMSFMTEEKAVVEKAQQILMGGGEVSTGVPQVDLKVQGTNPCVAALNNPKPIMVKQAKPQDVVKGIAKSATDTYKGASDAIKGGKPADVINNLKGMFGR